MLIMERLIPLVIVVTLSKADSVCVDTSTLTLEDVYLQNNLHSVASIPSVLDCAADCSSNSDCLSFGFEPDTRACHLHVKSSVTAANDMKEKKNWLHGDIAKWPKALLGPCCDHNCGEGDKCVINRVTEMPTCVRAKVRLPPGYCSVPLDIPNTNISTGRQQVGSVRTYTCNHGYLDTSKDAASATTTCMTNGWSPVVLNCSGPYIRMVTPSTRKYIFTLIPQETLHTITGDTSAIIFLAKTCRDLHIKMSTSFSDGVFYKVVIGGWDNTKSVIRTCNYCKENWAVHEEDGILICKKFKPFWISWANKTISVGNGRVSGVGVFMEWTPPGFWHITDLAIGSFKRNSVTCLFIFQI